MSNLAEYTFDDLQTKTLGEAFDAVCATVPDISYSSVVKEVIANKVIETAQQTGTSRSTEIVRRVLRTFGVH